MLPIKNSKTRGDESKRYLVAAEPWFIITEPEKLSSINLKLKSFEEAYLPSTLTGSSTLTNALRGNQKTMEFPPVADRQEKNIISHCLKGKQDNDTTFSQKIFAFVYEKVYQINTYRKLSRVS